MYIGSTSEAPYHGVEFDSTAVCFAAVGGTHIPGVVKLFDEILVNAMDNWERDRNTRNIFIDLPDVKDIRQKLSISVCNDGRGIPVVDHPTEKLLVPDLIMGHLLTGSNFDDSVATAAGGRHGFGAKLTNIFSTEFTVETGDSTAGKKFRKTWRQNMQANEKALVTDFPRRKGSDFTRVTFSPDLSRFGAGDGTLHAGTLHALYERAFQAAAVVGPLGVNVHVNGSALPVRGLMDYAKLCSGPSGHKVPLLEMPFPKSHAGHWQAVLGVASSHLPPDVQDSVVPLQTSDGHVECCSFVNGMRTYRGGSHVHAIIDPVAASIAQILNKKHKTSAITPALVKSHIRAFISTRLPDCSFDSQAKERLVSDIPAGFSPTVPDSFVKKLLDSGLETALMNTVNAKARANSARAVRKAVKDASVAHIPKLEDANWAGGRRSNQCTLILTEGDSAKALAMAGLAVVGRDKFGVFPLKGKVMNVRDLSPKAAVANAEIAALVSILGLDFNKSYEEFEAGQLPLRYGSVMIMADQDHDGSHIKGLLINLFHTFWPQLVRKCDGTHTSFLQQFITPVVKARRGDRVMEFFSLHAFQAWQAAEPSASKWKTKYYKGLGTSTSSEGRAYFSNLDHHRREFCWKGEADDRKLEMAFAKQQINARKEWLSSSTALNGESLEVQDTFEGFVDQELVHFSKADIVRSIPGSFDGLKPSQRKVLHACFHRPAGEVKVAQLAGFVSEFTAYHHGEASLVGTIVNMSQNFVGSNNVPLLNGVGQFGTRLAGGKDAASARYIFTQLSPVARALFPAADEELLPRNEEDGKPVEPCTYVPIAPLILMNGADGIGTGWSTSIPPHRPSGVLDVTSQFVRDCMENKAGLDAGFASDNYATAPAALLPWARGYRGTFELQENGSSFSTNGILELDSDLRLHRGQQLQHAVITELPFRKWTEDYRGMLRKLSAAGKITNIKEYHTEATVHFELDIVCGSDPISLGNAARLLKLQGSLSTSNMHAVDIHGLVVPFASPLDVFRHFIPVRHELYKLRQQLQVAKLRASCTKIENQVKFIEGVSSGKYSLGSRSVEEVVAALKNESYNGMDEIDAMQNQEQMRCLQHMAVAVGIPEQTNDSILSVEASDFGSPDASVFKYLLDMPISSMTSDRIQALRGKLSMQQEELRQLQSVTAAQLWLDELQRLKEFPEFTP